MLANGLTAAQHEVRMINMALSLLGEERDHFNPPPAHWDHLNPPGFKQLFRTRYQTDSSRARAAQSAQDRMQQPGETTEAYYWALNGFWKECGNANQLPEWMKVQKFINGLLPEIYDSVAMAEPLTMEAARAKAQTHYAIKKKKIQPSNSITADAALVALTEQVEKLQTRLADIQNQPPPRQLQEYDNQACLYCAGFGHFHAKCPIKRLHIQEGRPLNWAIRRPNPNRNYQGNGRGYGGRGYGGRGYNNRGRGNNRQGNAQPRH
jgi:hypothetical protein